MYMFLSIEKNIYLLYVTNFARIKIAWFQTAQTKLTFNITFMISNIQKNGKSLYSCRLLNGVFDVYLFTSLQKMYFVTKSPRKYCLMSINTNQPDI